MASTGSRMRCIGRFRRLASPSKVTVIGQPATAPISRRQPVPELPKSSASCGCRKPPTPTPCTRQAPSPVRSTLAPSARMALPVLRTSSPSSSPKIRVSPTASAPKISARCEIDLSPGTRTRPASAPERRADIGNGALVLKRPSLAGAALLSWGPPPVTRPRRRCAIDSGGATSQVNSPLDRSKETPVAKPELGSKRLCTHCGAKFYDLNKDPIVCPKWQHVLELAPVARGRPDAAARAAAPAAQEETVTPETGDAEFVSLEEADAEAQGKKPAGDAEAAEGADEDIELDD